jgi:hypothetical protein
MKRTDLASKVLVLVMLVLGSVFGNIPMVFGQVWRRNLTIRVQRPRILARLPSHLR